MADFDGDNRADLVIYRPSGSTWHALLSGTNYDPARPQGWQRGASGDRPADGDYDGDGREDIGTYRPSDGTWHVWGSRANYATEQTYAWGALNDRPVYVAHSEDIWPWA